MIKCKICDEKICKYKQDISSCDVIEILVDSKLKFEIICGDCARIIARQLIEQ